MGALPARYPVRLLLAIVSLAVLSAGCSSKARYVEEGKRRMQAGEYRRAEIAFRKALMQDAESGPLHEELAQAQLKQEKYAEAVETLRRTVTLMPENMRVRTMLVDVLLPAYFADAVPVRQLLDEAKGLQAQMEKRSPGAFDTLRIKAYIALAENRTEAAIEAFSQAHEAKRDNSAVLLRLADLLIAGKRAGEAETLLLRSLSESKPGDPAVFDRLYVQYRAAGKTADAEALLKRKVEAYPGRAEYRMQQAAHYTDAGRLNEAQAVLSYVSARPSEFASGDLHIGDFYVRSGKWAEAVRQYEQGIANDPKQRAVYEKRLFESYIAQGQTDAANWVLERILRDNPKDAPARIARATLRLDTAEPGAIDAAIKELQALTEESPGEADYHLYLGRAYLVSENIEAARAEFLQAVKQRPNFPAARVALSQMYNDAQQFNEALAQADHVLARLPTHPQARLARISALVGQGSALTARNELQRLVKEHPDFAAAQVQMAALDVREKRFAEAERTLRAQYKPRAADPMVLRALAELHLAQGNAEQAIGLLTRELQSAGSAQAAQPVRTLLGETAMLAGKTDLALEQFQLSLPHARQPAQVHYRMSALYAIKGEGRTAIQHLTKARELAPKDLNVQLSLAAMLETEGRLKEARTLYEGVLAGDPNNAVALNNLAFNLAETGGDLNEALRLAHLAVKKLPGNPGPADTLAWVHLKRKDLDPAVRILEDLARRYPGNSTFRYHLAVALFDKGDRTRARRELEAALSSKPPASEEKSIRGLMAKLS